MRVEIRNDSVIIDGYVNAVARDSKLLRSPRHERPFVEQVVPGAFSKAISRADNVRMLADHDDTRQVADVKSGTLEVYEDNIGLRAIATVTDEEVVRMAREKRLNGWSFGFRDAKDRFEKVDDYIDRRYLEDFDLTEVSLMMKRVPAYFGTQAETRADDGESVVTEYRSVDGVQFVDKKESKTIEDTDGDGSGEKRSNSNETDLPFYIAKFHKLKGKGV